MKILFYCIVLWGSCLFSLSAQTAEDYQRYLELRQQAVEISDNRGYWTVGLSGGATLYQGESDGGVPKKSRSLLMASWLSPAGSHLSGGCACSLTADYRKIVRSRCENLIRPVNSILPTDTWS